MKLKTELFLFLFLTGLTVIVITGTLYNYNAKKSMLSRLEDQLESLSETKKLRLEEILSSKLEDLKQIQNNTLLKHNLFLLTLDSIEKDKYLKNSYRLLIFNAISRSMADFESFKKVHVLDRKGTVVTSTDPSFIQKDLSGQSYFRKASAGKNNVQTNTEGDTTFYLEVSGPISYKNKIIGIVVIETNTSELQPITRDYTGLGDTGETTLAMLSSDSTAVYLDQLRFHPNPLFISTLDVNEPQAVFHALRGEEGILNDVKDYRNVPVFASARFIPEAGWGLITKIDQEEALKPMKEFQTMSYRIGFISVLVLSIIAFLFANQIVQPINQISEAAQRISKGDLALKVDIKRNNELGNLANCFNEMTKSLVEAQDNLQVKLQELDRSNVALEKFAYIVSHDLKAPLNSIASLSEIISAENHAKLNDEGLKMFSMLQIKVRQMHDLINGILEYSKIDHANSGPEEIDLEETVNLVKEHLSPPGHVHIDIVTPLPVIKFERILIFQVFQNLISNAIKYNNKQEVFIKIGETEEKDHYKFFVADNGYGIDERYLEKIFDIFTTLQPKGSGSTGIGLAIVKKIIENKGGMIYVQSKLREGSTFYFTIPKLI